LGFWLERIRLLAQTRSVAVAVFLRYETAMNLTFESERLLFRPLADTDLDVSMALLTDPDVIKYVGGRTYTKDEVVEDLPDCDQALCWRLHRNLVFDCSRNTGKAWNGHSSPVAHRRG